MSGSATEVSPAVQRLLAQEQYQQRTPQWYAVRDTMLTASDVAAALDIKPFDSFSGSPRKELLKKKLSPTAHFSNAFTAHGNQYEDVARCIYEERSGRKVLEFGLLVHAELKWLGASPDGVTTCGRAVEIKCPMSRPIIPGHVPEHYFPQVQIVMEVADLEEAVFIQYKPSVITWPRDEEFDVTVVKRDREWFAWALPQLQAFFDEVQAAKAAQRQQQQAQAQEQAPPGDGSGPSPPAPRQPGRAAGAGRSRKAAAPGAFSLCLVDDGLYSCDENAYPDAPVASGAAPAVGAYAFVDDD
jgi:putative phage-type endonuclease